MKYHHKQFGTVIVAALAAAFIFVAYSLVTSGASSTAKAWGLGLLAAILLLFHSLTVEIRDDALHLRMGIGLIRKRVPLSEITQARVVRIPVYAGWGIHGIPGVSWVWNVAGREGVALDLKRGERLVVGSDEAEELAKAIEANRPNAF